MKRIKFQIKQGQKLGTTSKHDIQMRTWASSMRKWRSIKNIFRISLTQNFFFVHSPLDEGSLMINDIFNSGRMWIFKIFYRLHCCVICFSKPRFKAHFDLRSLAQRTIAEHRFQFFAWNLVSVFYSTAFRNFSELFCAYWN